MISQEEFNAIKEGDIVSVEYRDTNDDACGIVIREHTVTCKGRICLTVKGLSCYLGRESIIAVRRQEDITDRLCRHLKEAAWELCHQNGCNPDLACLHFDETVHKCTNAQDDCFVQKWWQTIAEYEQTRNR